MFEAQIAFIGLGEAGLAFASGMEAPCIAFDRKTDVRKTRAAKQAEAQAAGVHLAESNRDAVRAAAVVLSLVTADQAVSAAEETAKSICPGSLYCDLNSVAPDTKREAAKAIASVGARYLDVAVMSPVLPRRRGVPLLVSGPDATAGARMLAAIGFGDVGIVSRAIGEASAIKMIRSVMVKGLEALTAECVLAAEAAGVRAEVLASLDASWPGTDWAAKADYNLDRMMIHGLRRAAEMEEVVKTLDALGTGSAMSSGTVKRQRALGQFHIAPPTGLAAKLRVLAPFFDLLRERAA